MDVVMAQTCSTYQGKIENTSLKMKEQQEHKCMLAVLVNVKTKGTLKFTASMGIHCDDNGKYFFKTKKKA